MLKTLFIISGNKKIGYGHIKRCELLAKVLKKDSYYFIGIRKNKNFTLVNNLDCEITNFTKSNTIKILEICRKYKINLVIIDHKNINFQIQKKLSKKYFLLVFDNHKKINFYADVILNANPTITSKNYYRRIKNKNTKLMLGKGYSLIYNPKKNKVKEDKDKIFICFGGGDDKSIIKKFLEFIKETDINSKLRFSFVLGPLNENYKKYQKIINEYKLKNVFLTFNPKNIHTIMQKCSFAITSPGLLFYELINLKKPTFLVYLNNEQKKLASAWVKNKLSVGCLSYNKLNFFYIMKKIILNKNKKKDLQTSFGKVKFLNNSKKIMRQIIQLYKQKKYE